LDGQVALLVHSPLSPINIINTNSTISQFLLNHLTAMVEVWRRGSESAKVGRISDSKIADFAGDSSGFVHYRKLFFHYGLLAILLAIVSQRRLPICGIMDKVRRAELRSRATDWLSLPALQEESPTPGR
jgi:hypothetical protein